MSVRFGGGRDRVRLRGRVTPPSDKSISHRAAIVGAMCEAPVAIAGYLDAADTRSTLQAMRRLGASVQGRDGELVIRGVGAAGPRCDEVLDVGNAGTLMRLLPGWLASVAGRSFALDGDASIRRRPVDRIALPLRAMGARVDARGGRFPPFTVLGAQLAGLDYELPVASAQVKSCVLLAGLATDVTTVREAVASRDHTERMLLAAGAPVGRRRLRDGGWVSSVGRAGELALDRIVVPADLSSAAFLITAAVLLPGAEVTLTGVGVNWTRSGFLEILRRMGARVGGELEPPGTFAAAEPICDLEVAHGALTGTEVGADEVPLAIDELPLVALLGCFAEGETVVRGAAELRVKESDRIATVVDGLRGLGADIEALPDGFAVRAAGGLRGGRLDAHGDHRLALLGAVAGLASQDGVEVIGMEAAAVSYPGFADDLRALSH
ncbi:MAG: 3-phosphoshikimate 1-carboxyvinyltransferase [Solirubrobacterales bacterium]|nr:3-phosphoshikimate 1-carboxyvinyltransferase [Solirubrobacterales bacterium]